MRIILLLLLLPFCEVYRRYTDELCWVLAVRSFSIRPTSSICTETDFRILCCVIIVDTIYILYTLYLLLWYFIILCYQCYINCRRQKFNTMASIRKHNYIQPVPDLQILLCYAVHSTILYSYYVMDMFVFNKLQNNDIRNKHRSNTEVTYIRSNNLLNFLNSPHTQHRQDSVLCRVTDPMVNVFK